MKKRALRLFLGAGYVMLLTLLLLYQAGVLGERREWGVATLTTLLLGVALAVVLLLYIRVNDQIRQQEQSRTADETGPPENRSYEEIYAAFLTAVEGYAVSERELEVAWLLYRGYTNRQIGEELYIAETPSCIPHLSKAECGMQEGVSGLCTGYDRGPAASVSNRFSRVMFFSHF